tara:strand:+ start:370 stop:555 length:186 start_codon:yes stop_codon:yes gene_type:complete
VQIGEQRDIRQIAHLLATTVNDLVEKDNLPRQGAQLGRRSVCFDPYSDNWEVENECKLNEY